MAEISNFTKVKQDHLQKIEDGDFEKLPPDVYVKGFLKSYAKFFNLDPDEIISYYEKEIGIRNNIKKYQNPIQRKKRELFPNIAITPKVFTALFSALVVIGGFAYFYLEIEKFSKDPRLVILQPSSQSSVDKSSVEIIGLTDEENKVTINGQPIRINNQGEFKENLGLHKGVNKVVIQAKNKFGAATEREFNISADFKVASVREWKTDRTGKQKKKKREARKKNSVFP